MTRATRTTGRRAARLGIPESVRITRTHNVVDLQMEDALERLERLADEAVSTIGARTCEYAATCRLRHAKARRTA